MSSICYHCREGQLDADKWHYCYACPEVVACEKPRPIAEKGEKIKIERRLSKLYYFKPVYIDGLRAARYTIKHKQEPGSFIWYCPVCHAFHLPSYRYDPCLINLKNPQIRH